MRVPTVVFLSCCLLASPSWAAGPQTFPYTAYVTADDVYVRSGPGDNYYPTDKLKAETEVEIYRHDPGGWYAIRPPAGSFSWVAGRHLELRDNNLAVAKEDRVAVRVGSRFSDVRDVIQVRLHRGEVVEVLDAKRTGPATTTSAGTWYKAAPPAGEFRWVFGKFVDPEYARDGLRKSPAPANPAAASATTAAQAPAAATSTALDAKTPTPAEAASASVPAAPVAEAAAGAATADPGPAIPRRASAGQFQSELNDIDVELSAMVVEEASVWDFGELRVRTEALLNQAETAPERGRARMLLSKIARFEDIKQRYNSVAALRDQTVRIDRQLARLAPRPAASAAPAIPPGVSTRWAS